LKLDVKIQKKFGDESKTKAIVDVVMDNDFVIKGVKIVDGVNGLFITMPNKKDQKGNYHDACFPITAKFRNELNEAVLSVYQTSLAIPAIHNESGIKI
jgi:stage V sporulation protein G